jgi:hypothetical protein
MLQCVQELRADSAADSASAILNSLCNIVMKLPRQNVTIARAMVESKPQPNRTPVDSNPSGPAAPITSIDFLSGGGRMGALMRTHNWSATAFGDPAAWPQSLRSALSICLESEFQIAIY